MSGSEGALLPRNWSACTSKIRAKIIVISPIVQNRNDVTEIDSVRYWGCNSVHLNARSFEWTTARVTLNCPPSHVFQRSRRTMREALRSPAHQRAPESAMHMEPASHAGITPRKSAPNPLLTLRGVRSLRKSNALPSPLPRVAPLDKSMQPPPRPNVSAGKLDTDLFARRASVSARRVLDIRPLPAPVKNGIVPLATACEQDSTTSEPVVYSGSTAPGPTDLSPTAQRHARSDARASADERSRRMADLEKDKREMRLLFVSRRDAGCILDVTGSSRAPAQEKVTGSSVPSVPRRHMPGDETEQCSMCKLFGVEVPCLCMPVALPLLSAATAWSTLGRRFHFVHSAGAPARGIPVAPAPDHAPSRHVTFALRARVFGGNIQHPLLQIFVPSPAKSSPARGSDAVSPRSFPPLRPTTTSHHSPARPGLDRQSYDSLSPVVGPSRALRRVRENAFSLHTRST